MWKIKLTLEGNLKHELGDVRSGKPGWAECSPSGILKLEFPFTGKVNGKEVTSTLLLSGMEKYNFFVEAMRAVGSGKTKIKGMWFLGKIPNVDRVVGFVIGDGIKHINTVFGNEYNGFSTVGWKHGILKEKVICSII